MKVEANKDGRDVIVKGRINSTVVALVNIDAPPESDLTCLKLVFDQVISLSEGIYKKKEYYIKLQRALDSIHTTYCV